MNKSEKILISILFTIIVLFLLFNVGMAIYVYVMYGNKPISEIPGWALVWF